MNTKRLFFSLTHFGVRITILVSMLMMALIGNVSGVAAAPPQTLTSVSVVYQSGTLTYNSNVGSRVYNVTMTRNGIPLSPVGFFPSVTGLPAGVSGTFSPAGVVTFATGQTTRVITLTLTKSAAPGTNAGNYTFTVTASSLNGSPSGTGTLAISKANQTITFAALSNKTYGDANFTVSATASSGLPVSFTPSGSCSMTGTTVQIIGAGSCTITASQAGNTNYNAAPNVARSFTIAQASQTITFGALADKTFGDPDFAVSATASSGLPVSFSASGDCTVDSDGDPVQLTGVGSCTITASQAGNGSYLPAANVLQSFTINPPVGPSTSFDLYAVTGSTTLPGFAGPVTVWGYNTINAPVSKPGGPVLVVNQGDPITITLHNELSEPTALLLQGQSMIPDLTGAAPGGTKTYTFTASKPGTFLYEAGLLPNAQHQVAMGLYGALVVRPTGAPSQAYAGSATVFDAEQVLVLSELDTALNTSSDPSAFDIRLYNPKYYLINGEAYPDTDPISVAAGDDVLLRYVNAGLQAHSMSTLGLPQRIIGQDGIANSYGRTVVAETIATGQTLDVIVTISGSADQYPLYDASLFLRNNTGGNTFAGLGGMLTVINVGSPVLPGDTTGPIASTLNLAPNPTDATADVIVTANISDSSTGNSPVAAAEFYIDTTAGSPTGMTASDTVFNSPTESVTGTIPVATLTILSPGLHTIYVRGQDSAGNWGSFQTIVLDVDVTLPSAGTLHFSTAGITASGPGGVGADSGDIYYFDGSAFDPGIIDAPAGANVDGFDRVSDTDFYMSFTADVTLPVIGAVQNEDVVHFDGANWTVYFDGTANGLGASNIDAISVSGSTLYFSLSDTTLPTGVTGVGDDADIYAWDGATYTRLFDATVEGWSGNNVDGFVYVDAIHFYLSYSPTGTSVSGLGTVQDEDVVYYSGGVWSVYFDGTVNGLTSTSLDIDAFDIP